MRTLSILLVISMICSEFIPASGKQANANSSGNSDFCLQLLQQMTLEEKIGQLHQLSLRGDIGEETKKAIRAGKVGSVINIEPRYMNQVQEIAVKESRLKIPLLYGRDVIHGYKTIFPIPLGQAATFNPGIVREGARIAATEAYSEGIRWTFAPMLDISRDARWGRIAESLGEDPYLSSVLGAAMIEGFQGKSLADKFSIAACAKHFVGYGAAEGGRDYNSTNIPPVLMHNVYLAPFRAANQAGAASFMASFNDNDGIPLTGDTELLRNVLKKRWQFPGVVVSDWNAINEMIKHGFATNRTESALKALQAGIDIDMMSSAYTNELQQLIAADSSLMTLIDDAVLRVLRMKQQLGLFEKPYNEANPSVLYAASHLESARQAAEESFVLLKNNNLLPLKPEWNTLAVIGPMADAPHDQLGTWVFDGEKEKTITPLRALQEYTGRKLRILYEPGLEYSRDMSRKGFKTAVEVVQKSDVVLLFLGEESILSGEAHSMADLNLVGLQSELVTEISKTGKPLVLVVMAGRPLTIEKEIEQAGAVLYGFHPGTMGGPAIARILLGDVNPSGKLPVSFPRHTGQIPVHYNHNATGRPAPDKLPSLYEIPREAKQTSLGNTSFYLDYGFRPLFPFGYGLSYTRFEYSDFKITRNELQSQGEISFSVKLRNTGNYAGTEVVQLYVQDVVASVARPVKELKRFERVQLKPGEQKEVVFTLITDDLSFYGRDLIKTIEKGLFRTWVGTDSSQGLQLEFKY